MSEKSLIDKRGKSITFSRVTKTKSSTGAFKSSTTLDTTSYMGWIQPVSHTESLDFAQRGFHATHKLYMYDNPGELNPGDTVSYGSDIFTVVTSPEDQAGIGRMFVVLLES